MTTAQNIYQADYEKMAQSQAGVMGYQPGSLQYNIICSQFKTLWKDWQKEIDMNNDGEITLEEFLQYKDKQLNAKEGYRPYGVEQMCKVISQNWHLSAQEIKQGVIDDLRRHIGTQKVFDDITPLVLKRTEVGVETESQPQTLALV